MAIVAKRVTSSGALLAAPGRVLGVYAAGGGAAGTVELKDGGSGGTSRFLLDVPAGVFAPAVIHGGGLVFGASVYAVLTTAAGVTVIIEDGT